MSKHIKNNTRMQNKSGGGMTNQQLPKQFIADAILSHIYNINTKKFTDNFIMSELGMMRIIYKFPDEQKEVLKR